MSQLIFGENMCSSFTKDENGSYNLEQDVYYTKPQRIMVNTIEEIRKKKELENKDECI